MDVVARIVQLVTLDQRHGIEVQLPPGPQVLYDPSDRGERSVIGVEDPPAGAALAPEINGEVQPVRIENPPLGSANTAWIRQEGLTA